jgi:hypothetical protein
LLRRETTSGLECLSILRWRGDNPPETLTICQIRDSMLQCGKSR